jgi:hypothetical protein
MRERRIDAARALVAGVVVCVSLAAPVPSTAAPLTFTGFLVLNVGTVPLVVPGAGVANFTSALGDPDHLSTLALGGGTFAVTTLAAQFTLNDSTVQGLSFRGFSNQSGVFAGLSGGPPGGGAMGLNGVARVCGIGMFYPGYNPACTPTAALQLDVPLVQVGAGGTETIQGAINLTLLHNPWTIGTSTANPPGFVHNAGSSGVMHTAGSSSVTTTGFTFQGYATPPSDTAAPPSGILQLVTVTKVFTDLTASFPFVPVVGVLQLHFVPEPGTFLLLATGSGALAALVRRRIGRR